MEVLNDVVHMMGEAGEELNIDIPEKVRIVTSIYSLLPMLLLFQTQEHIEHVLDWLNQEINVADLPQMFEDANPEVKQSNQMKCHKSWT